MKILFITNNYKPYSGGVVSSIEAFRYELKQQGHDVKVVTFDFVGDGIIEPDVIRLSSPLRFTYKDNPIAVPLFARQQLATIIDQEQPAIVHAHHPFVLGPAAAKAAKEKKIPVIFTNHSYYGVEADSYAPFLKKLTRAMVEEHVRLFCGGVDRIVAPTHSVKRQLEAQQVNTPIHVIPNGILPVFMWQKNPQKEVEKEYFNLLTVSKLDTEKNIQLLLDVMTELDESYRLTIIGSGGQLEYLKAYAFEACQLTPDRVRFIENVPKAVLAQHYYEADLFLYAGATETNGLIFAESMAAGTPVIAVKSPGAQDCVQSGFNGFLIDTHHEMREKIVQLKNDNKLYQELHHNAWITAQDYCITATAQQLLKLYQDLV